MFRESKRAGKRREVVFMVAGIDEGFRETFSSIMQRQIKDTGVTQGMPENRCVIERGLNG